MTLDTRRSLRIPAELERVADVRKLVRDVAGACDAPQPCMDDLVQAVDEAATNVIVHGYRGKPGWLDVEISGVPENLDVVYRLLDAERNEIQYWVSPPRVGGVTTGSTKLPAAGWYWMEIRDSNNDARSPYPFTVKRWFRPE